MLTFAFQFKYERIAASKPARHPFPTRIGKRALGCVRPMHMFAELCG